MAAGAGVGQGGRAAPRGGSLASTLDTLRWRACLALQPGQGEGKKAQATARGGAHQNTPPPAVAVVASLALPSLSAKRGGAEPLFLSPPARGRTRARDTNTLAR